MIGIECLACGKAIKPQQLNDTHNYDTENYDGHVVCQNQECKSLLYVKLVKGKVQKYKIVKENFGAKPTKITRVEVVMPQGEQQPQEEENGLKNREN